MSHAYTTTTHHFGECKVRSVHRKFPKRDEVEILAERYEAGGVCGDQITFFLNNLGAKELCRGLLNIIGPDIKFHKELEDLMRVLRMPE